MGEIRYALFDLDGTLSESAPGITKCVQYALRHFGIEEPDLKKLETFVGPPLRDEFRKRYGFDDAQCTEAVEIYRERYRTTGIFECGLYEGVPEMLRKCHEKGIRLAVASSKPEVFVVQIMEHFHVAQYFDVMCGADLSDDRKNITGADGKEMVVRRALAALSKAGSTGEDPDYKKSCVMIGDRNLDIVGAIRNGVIPVGVTFGYGTRQELEEAHAEHIFDTVQDLEEFLLSN